MALYLSNGIGNSFSYQVGINVYPTDKWQFYTGDFNGDGRNDFLCKSNNPPIGFSGYQLCNSITERDKLLKSVTDSYGNATSFTYKSMTDQTVYSPHTDGVYPVSDFTGALPLVDKMTQPDGLGGTKNISYKYAGAKLHKQGKGFLGFSKFTVKDEQTGISSIAFYEYDPTKYAVGLKRTETRLSKNQYNNFLLSETDYTNIYREYNGYHSVPIFTYQVAASEEKHYELNSSSPYKTITSSYTYDDYGNALTTSQSIGNEYTVSSVNEYTNNTSSWFLGRLTKATVTKQTTGKPDIVRTSEFEYDPVSGMLTKEIVEPDNNDLGFSKTYEHDSYGNIEKSIVTTNDETRQQHSVYNDKGRFVVETYNPLGHKNSQTYDHRFGTVTSHTDPNLLSVSTIYDSFGRPKLITGADGAKKVVAYRWCMGQGDEPEDALWFKYVEVTGSPGTKVYYDKLGRELRTETIGFDSKVIWVDTEYNARGQVSRQSDPYFKDETAQWTSFTYDELGRLKQKDLPNGAVIKVTYNGLSLTTENPLQQITTKRTNQQGQLVESTDDEGNSVTYVYDSAGNLIETYNSQGNVIKMEYDLLGNRTKLIDPELGTITSVYNAFGELTSETDANSNQLVLEYDQLGRMTTRTEAEGITTWVYDTGNCGIGRPATVNGPGGYKQEMEYDNLGRIIKIKETIAGTVYTTTTQYDSYSRVLRTNYPSVNGNGPVIRNVYNTNGYLSQVKDNQTGDVYWTANTMNAQGQFEAITYGNGLNATYQYNNSTGQLIHQKTMTSGNLVQEWDYGYDAIGNLKRRTDYKRGGTVSELFDYDNLNRLIEVQNNAGTLTMTYDDLGNILTKSDVGEYHYNDPLRPYTVTGITPGTGSLLRSFDQRITYTSFDKVKSIAQNSDSLHLFYGSSYERIYADSYQSNVLKKRRTYVNKLYEQEKDFTTGNIRETFYIFGGDGLTAIRVRDTSGDHINYVHKDHLGSIQCLTNEVGVLVQEFSYDAWGNRRDPATLQVYVVVQTGLITDRGFTGHEHIDLFDLVNMDGRVYDPVIGRFISADPLIQDPENLQSLNRYAYCLNNPLIFIDPSGYSWLSDNWRTLVATGIAITVSTLTAGLGSTLGIAIIAGAAGGFAGGFSGALLCGADMGQALKAGAIGGVIGAATGFLNFAAGSTSATSSFGKILEKAGKHAFADVWMGGVKNAVYGGDLSPVRDMIGGALSSLGNGLISDHVNSTALKVASSAVLGGTISEIGGGKFANGAVTGAYSMLFNDMMHELKEDKATKKLVKAKNAVETVKDTKDALNGDKYAQVKIGTSALSVLQAIPKAVGKFLSNAFDIIEIYVFYMDNVAPMVDQSLQSEGKINPPKQNIKENLNPNYGRKGYWSNGRWYEE